MTATTSPTEPAYTEAELKQFNRLSWLMSSSDQVTRIRGRIDMRAFIDTHGKEKCDAMWAELKRRDEANRKAKRRSCE